MGTCQKNPKQILPSKKLLFYSLILFYQAEISLYFRDRRKCIEKKL